MLNEVLKFIADCQEAITRELEQSDLKTSDPYYMENVARHVIALGMLEKAADYLSPTYVKEKARMHRKLAILYIREFRK